MSDNDIEQINLDMLSNNYVQSDLEDEEEQSEHELSQDGFSDTESVNINEDDNYRVFSTLLEDEKGTNISDNIRKLNHNNKSELSKINKNLEMINISICSLHNLLQNYMKMQLTILKKNNKITKKNKKII